MCSLSVQIDVPLNQALNGRGSRATPHAADGITQPLLVEVLIGFLLDLEAAVERERWR